VSEVKEKPKIKKHCGLFGTTKNEPKMQENLKSRNLNQDCAVLCLFYQAVSPELFRVTACMF
jgi:hypothetical protein